MCSTSSHLDAVKHAAVVVGEDVAVGVRARLRLRQERALGWPRSRLHPRREAQRILEILHARLEPPHLNTTRASERAEWAIRQVSLGKSKRTTEMTGATVNLVRSPLLCVHVLGEDTRLLRRLEQCVVLKRHTKTTRQRCMQW